MYSLIHLVFILYYCILYTCSTTISNQINTIKINKKKSIPCSMDIPTTKKKFNRLYLCEIYTTSVISFCIKKIHKKYKNVSYNIYMCIYVQIKTMKKKCNKKSLVFDFWFVTF